MAERMYALSEEGVRPLDETAYERELALQTLISRHPELLAGEQLTPDEPRRMLLLAQEVGVAEGADSSNRWSLDHLFVDQDAVPVLVETKLATNPEIRRAVVGQMLDYAANAQYWNLRALREQYEASPAASSRLERLLQSDGEVDADEFWMRFETNLRGHRMRLLFVADEVPSALAATVTFLNEQTPDSLQVLAVELKQFGPPENRLFVPRVIGHVPKRSSASRTSTNREAFLGKFDNPEARAVAERILNAATANGASLEWGSRGVSVRGRSPVWKEPVTIAWLYPSETGWMRTRYFSFGAGILSYDNLPASLDEELRRYVQQFDDLSGHEDASSEGVLARAFTPSAAVANADRLSSLLVEMLGRLRTLVPETPSSPAP